MSILNIQKAYNRNDFISYLQETLFTDFVRDEHKVELGDSDIFSDMRHLGVSNDCDVSVFEANCSEKDSKKRIAVTQNAFRVLRQHGIANAVIAFTYGTSQWRLSLLTSKLELKDGKIVTNFSNPRRYSYLLGDGSKTHTPYKYLIDRGSVSSLDELRGRFSVEVVNKQFYDEIAKHFTELVGGERGGVKYDGLLGIYGLTKPSVKFQEFAVRLIGRIMFCWFLKEKKSANGTPLIPERMLSRDAVAESTDYYHTVLEPLFFELLNTKAKRRKGDFKKPEYSQIPYLNGGLFSPQKDDYYKFNEALSSGAVGIVTIPDKWFSSLYAVLESYSFTVDENTAYDVELSIDPEMLGRIFENLLAEINPETGESAKKSTGSFYTPRDIVDYMVDSSLYQYLKQKTGIEDAKLAAVISYGQEDDEEHVLSDDDRVKIVNALSSLTILDPACGSGAFPIGILQKVVYILQQVDENSKLWVAKQYSSVTSAELKQDIKDKQERGLFDYIRKLGVIRESIFGIDIQTIATEIAKLRCFLSLIVEENVEDEEPNRGIQPLPNLDFKFISANSLVRLENDHEAAGQSSLFEDLEHIEELKRIRDEYFTADSDERSELRDEFNSIQKDMLLKTINNFNKVASNRYNRLSSWRPFENESTFWFDPEWMFGTDKFDIVIANPPYIHLEHMKDKSKEYKEMRFSTYEARGDIYALFYEKGVSLLKNDGILCYITSNKWMRAAYGKSLRRFFANNTNPITLIDFAGQQIFDATVDTNILLLSKSENKKATAAVSVKDKESINNLSDYIKQNSVEVAFDSEDSWTILSPIEQSIKRKIEAVGTPLKDWDVKINRGILTGCNEAFIITAEKREEILMNCNSEEERTRTAELIRPILRGRDVKRYGYDFADLYLIAAHNGYRDDHGNDIPPINIDFYPAIKTHLDEFWDIISVRTDKGVTPYNLRNCAYMDDFSKQKIVWKRIGSILRFAYDDDGCLGLDSTCIGVSAHAKFLTAYLNSRVGNYLLSGSPKTGTGDLLVSVQAIEPILAPKMAETLCLPTIDEIISKARDEVDTYEIESALDAQLYTYFDFTPDEQSYIANITEPLRRQ
jgi:type I restriction-modification system DNA methylase subunit